MTWRPVDLKSVVSDAVDMLGPRIEEFGATVQINELPIVPCDRYRIREVFYNLILNALKYNDRDDKRVEVGYLERDGVLYVRDNGIGIKEEYLEEIFGRRLHASDEYGGGTGSGLTVARGVVERHGGRMWVESIPWVGSKFCFTLPGNPEVREAGGE